LDIIIVIVAVLNIDWRRSLGSFGIFLFAFSVVSTQAHIVADHVIISSGMAYAIHLLCGINSKVELMLIKLHRGRDEDLSVGSRQQQTILSVTNVTQLGSAHCLFVELLKMWERCKGDTAKRTKLADIRHNAICSFSGVMLPRDPDGVMLSKCTAW
jgi:hypothetical protein